VSASWELTRRPLPARPTQQAAFKPRRIFQRAGVPGHLALLDAQNQPTATPGRVLTGVAATFDQWIEVNNRNEGHFLERINKGAFAKTISEGGRKAMVMFNHGEDVLGAQLIGELGGLSEDDGALRYTVDLYEGLPELLMDGLRNGAYGSSFRARTVKSRVVRYPARSAHNPTRLAEVTRVELQLLELGPVSSPAYKQTTAQVRSAVQETTRTPRDRPASHPNWWLEPRDPAWLLGGKRHAAA
jgi:phage head maturation protease